MVSDEKDLKACFLVLESEANDPELHERLLKIINALKFQANKDYQIIQCRSTEYYSIAALSGQDNLTLICFGIPPSKISLQGFSKQHHLYSIKNLQIVFANPLASYSDDVSKKILWNVLKQIS